MITINYTTGYAGTGKSTKLLNLLPTLPVNTSVVLGPTHKALKRLREEYVGSIELKTIHSLLGLIPQINEEAKHVNNLHSLQKLDNDLDAYTDIVIDEAGMINEEHFHDLIGKMDDLGCEVTLHLYMDPYQLLPVKGYQIMTDPSTTTNLTTQYRSKSLDIVETYTKFVDFIQGNGDDLTVPYSKNIKQLDITKFKRGDRLLAYTNKAVGEWNTRVASQLGIKGYEGQEVQIGANETVVIKNFYKPSFNEIVDAYNSNRLKLQNSQITKRFLEQSLKALLSTTGIQFIVDTEDNLIPVLVGIGEAQKVLKAAGTAAIQNRSKFVHVYALGRAYIMDYPFATTVHKAQGAEFDTVFIDKLDIQKSIRNNYYEAYARLMYVSISRCKETLYI